MADVTIGELKGILTLQDQFSGPLNDATKQLGLFSESFGAITKLSGLAAAGVTAVGGAIAALGSHGSEVADVAESFDGLSKAAGSSAAVMLGNLRQGVQGTISDFQLMEIGSRALGAGIIKNAADMSTLAEGARGLAKATGTTTAEAFATLTQAMSTGRTAGLANAGLMVDTKNATIAYANSLGVSVGELTKHEKAVAGSTAILAALNARFHDRAPADFGEMIEQAKVGVQNFVDKLSVAISQSPVILYAFKTIGQELQNAFGSRQEEMVASLTKGVGQFAIGLTYVAQGGLVAASVIVTAWYGVKTAILAVETAIVGVSTALVAGAESSARMAASIPGLSDKAKAFAASAAAAKTELAGMTTSLAQQTAEAAKGVIGQSALQASIDKANGIVINARDGMVKLAGAHAVAAQGARDFAVAQQQAGVVAESAARKIEEAFIKMRADIASAGKDSLDRQLIQMEAAYKIELLHLKDLKDATAEQQAEMATLAKERYDKEVAAAKAGGDQILQATTKIENQLALLQASGLKKELLSVEQQRKTELDGLTQYAAEYSEKYTHMATVVNQVYDEMTKAAKKQYTSAEQYAAAAGLQTREEMQNTVDQALIGYSRMEDAGTYTASQLKKAWQAYLDAVDAMEGKHQLSSLEKFQAIAAGASGILKDLFGKNKAAMIAAAIIEGAAAVVTSFKNGGGWPWGLIPAAAMAAATVKQVNEIRNTDAGFAEGTPDMAFLDFGRGSQTTLHAEEAIINRRQGDTLAEQLTNTVKNALHEGKVSTVVHQHLSINEDPIQTHESREKHRAFTLKAVAAEQNRHLSRMVALGMA